MGSAVTPQIQDDRIPAMRQLACRATLVSLLIVSSVSLAVGEERYAIIVAGASGGPGYAQQYGGWTKTLSQTLVERLGFDPSHVTTLSDTPEESTAATAANLRRVLAERRSQLKPDDLLLLFLIGHGTFDGVDAKFNLVGPDLEAAEWATLLRGMPGRLVIVNGAPASSPFIEGRGPAADRHLGHRFRRPAVRHRLSRVLHRRIPGRSRRYRQERPDFVVGGVCLGGGCGPSVLPGTGSACYGTSAARRQRRRRRPRGLGPGTRRLGGEPHLPRSRASRRSAH